MAPDIRETEQRILVGMSMEMSLVANQTPVLFQNFMPIRKMISNVIGSAVYDLRIYPEDYFIEFSPDKMFRKWAAMRVSQMNPIPEKMDLFTLEPGLYAVFTLSGNTSQTSPFTYIFQEWLPSSEYSLDSRPHFDLIEPGPKPGTSLMEEIWIPIQPK